MEVELQLKMSKHDLKFIFTAQNILTVLNTYRKRHRTYI